MDVAGYIRVSTEQQKQEGSHENQRDRLVNWADRAGHDIELYEDIAISGQSDDRPEYDDLMDRAIAKEFDAVAVRELSRFGRSLQQVLQDIERLNENDVEFISVTESFDTSSAMGKAMMQMIGVFNEFWANLSRERAQEYVERQREKGESIGRPRKLNEEQMAQVLDWHESGIGYATIAKLCVSEGWVENIDRSTIRRYCKET